VINEVKFVFSHVSGQKVPVARLAKPPKAEFTWVNEYFGDKNNEANGTLWPDFR